jgi:glycosyltransferase involved in cell wall biosynthesis
MTIHNGIDVEHFADRYTEHEKSEARKTYGFTDSDFVVGLCAAMRPEKAHGDLLEAVSLARKRGENVKCLLIGDGPERARIEEKIRELQLRSHVVITGFIADVRMLLATCDAIALVSHSIETFSIAALEAMAMGKPMLMSRTGGADEQVSHGQNGFLFTPRNVEELASHMVAVARAGTTRDMGRLARDRVVSQFSVQRMLAAYQALFVDLVPKRGKDELANWPNP